MNQVQQTKVTSVLSEPQRALLSTITAGHEVIHIAETELSTKAQRPQLGTDPASLRWIEQTIDTHKQNVGSQIAAMNAATAQVVTLTSGPADNVDHTAVGAAITTIATNLPEMTKGVRMIAALMDDESSGERLLDAARKLCTAFSDLLKATEPETKEVSDRSRSRMRTPSCVYSCLLGVCTYTVEVESAVVKSPVVFQSPLFLRSLSTLHLRSTDNM